MKKIIYLFLLVLGVTGCSDESIDSTENLLTADAKAGLTVQSASMAKFVPGSKQIIV